MKNRNLSLSSKTLSNPANPLLLALGSLVGCTLNSNVVAQSMQPPEFQIIDPLGINMASGSPSFKVDDLSIGAGELSLSHSISSYGGYFYGYVDLYQIGHNPKQFKLNSEDANNVNGREVHFPGGSKLFLDNGDGTFTDFKQEGDSLDIVGGKYVLTQRNGTEIHYGPGFSAQIIHPNGFTVTVNRLGWRFISVTTNNGLQLEYNYSVDTLVTSSDPDQNAKNDWVYHYPTSIQAINNAVSYCDPDNKASCNLTDWPESTYTWHDDMPVFIYQNFSDYDVLTVEDMTGYSTTFRHSAFDEAPCQPDETPPCNSHPDVGKYFQPRVTTLLEENQIIRQYHYENKQSCRSTGGWGPVFCQVNVPAMLKTVTAYSSSGSHAYNYSLGVQGGGYGQFAIENTSIGLTGGVRVENYKNTGAPMKVGQNGIVHRFQTAQTNRLTSRENGNYRTEYEFDARKNLTEIKEIGATGSDEQGQELITLANYDADCDDAKTCNQPNWIQDRRGNKTYFQYHEPSGQPLVVTKPADANGVHPQTRYTYQQYYAWYHRDGNSTPDRADSPIWLLSEERSCITGDSQLLQQEGFEAGQEADTDSNGNLDTGIRGCNTANDEIVITYDYGVTDGTVANNLFLKGKTVTTPEGARTTCYDYDNVGNVIGETEPKGAVSGCNQE